MKKFHPEMKVVRFGAEDVIVDKVGVIAAVGHGLLGRNARLSYPQLQLGIDGFVGQRPYEEMYFPCLLIHLAVNIHGDRCGLLYGLAYQFVPFVDGGDFARAVDVTSGLFLYIPVVVIFITFGCPQP